MHEVNVTTEQEIWQENEDAIHTLSQSCTKLSCENACFKVDILKMTFEMTRKICKLVKESPQRNNRLEEIRKTTKNEAKNVHSFCQQDGQCVVKH